MIQMGAMYRDPIATSATPKLEEILEKGETGDITLQDFEGLAIVLSVGGLQCVATADGKEAVDALKAANLDAYFSALFILHTSSLC